MWLLSAVARHLLVYGGTTHRRHIPHPRFPLPHVGTTHCQSGGGTIYEGQSRSQPDGQ